MSNYPDWAPKSLRNSLNIPRPEPFELPDIPARPTVEHAERQIELADQQVEMLAAMQKLWESQAAEASANAQREAEQQKFNRSMTWVAIILAGAAVLVPFIILWIEQALAVARMQ